MKKLILMATVILALTYQSSKAQVSFSLNVSSGPAYYEPAYYRPAYYAPAPRYVYVEKKRPVYHKKFYVEPRGYYRPSYQTHYVNYNKHYYKKPHHKKHRR